MPKPDHHRESATYMAQKKVTGGVNRKKKSLEFLCEALEGYPATATNGTTQL